MAVIKCTTIEDDRIQDFENVKELVLSSLVNEGLLEAGVAEEFCRTYGIVLYKESWYKRIFKDGKDEMFINCVKLKDKW